MSTETELRLPTYPELVAKLSTLAQERSVQRVHPRRLEHVETCHPPPVIKVGCGCTTPPNPTPLVYEGAHSDAKGISGRDVLRWT